MTGLESTVLVDVIAGLELPLINGAAPLASAFGPGIDSHANDRGARVLAPASVKGQAELTMVWIGMTQADTPSSGAVIFWVSANNTDSSPYVMAGFSVNSSNNWRGDYSIGGSYVEIGNFAPPAVGDLTMLVLTLRTGGTGQTLYKNGTAIAAQGNTWVGGTTSATSQIAVGTPASNLGRNSKVLTFDARIYARSWTAANVTEAWNSGSPWGLYRGGSRPRSGFGAQKPSRRRQGRSVG